MGFIAVIFENVPTAQNLNPRIPFLTDIAESGKEKSLKKVSASIITQKMNG